MWVFGSWPLTLKLSSLLRHFQIQNKSTDFFYFPIWIIINISARNFFTHCSADFSWKGDCICVHKHRHIYEQFSFFFPKCLPSCGLKLALLCSQNNIVLFVFSVKMSVWTFFLTLLKSKLFSFKLNVNICSEGFVFDRFGHEKGEKLLQKLWGNGRKQWSASRVKLKESMFIWPCDNQWSKCLSEGKTGNSLIISRPEFQVSTK